MKNKHLINTIYRATEGEGLFLGRAQVFVRYQGCNVGCINCDSKETWDFTSEYEKDLSWILEEIKKEGFNGLIKNVSITGGDPLHPSHVPHVLELVLALKAEGYYVNIEAAGTRVVDEIFSQVDYISYDLKTPSTGVKTPVRFIEKMNEVYPGKFQVKAVISDKADFDYTYGAFKDLSQVLEKFNFTWVLTPCYNTEEPFPMERFIEVIKWNEEIGGVFRVIGQQHKWIFGPSKKNV